jgi:hypothetical protein
MSCYICRTPTKDGGIICDKTECKIKVETSAAGTYVVDRLQGSWARLLITLTYVTLISERRGHVFIPAPLYFMTNGKRDFKRLVESITKLYTAWREICQTKANTDIELKKEIGEAAFCLLKFILMSQIHKLEELEVPKSITKTHSVKVFRILSLKRREEEFAALRKINTSQLLFHGSQTPNWYSILRNGLRNCSKTALMVYGNTQGDGVYLSDNLATSYGYSHDGTGIWMVPNQAQSAERFPRILGIAEVAQGKQKYYKTTHEFVVANDKEVLLRYIMVYYDAPTDILQDCLNHLKITVG